MQTVSEKRAWRVGVPVNELTDARDRDLLARLSEGDEEAFRALFRRYAPAALALALRIIRDHALAEEVVQEAFLSLWLTADRFDESRGSARAWLMGMIRNRAIDAVRREETQRRRSQKGAGAEVVPIGDPAEEVVEQVALSQERRAVRSALDGLPPEQRDVLELMYFEGLSQSKVAERLALPLGTVKSRTLIGMRRLRGALAGTRG
jgi:RNA polymerase sigma-70 factor (ECF subfamily)